ncbi:MAG TPA: TIGR04211 family SH3 domain-containing protein [Gammaproteobacteria bacterium]|mgnify:CR=1 FL=1|nr:TIGR04211 family SH3 domain-containing protein [Gammaproteobacteria bacterium]
MLRVACLLLVVLCMPRVLAAEAAFVIDKLLVGVHKEADLNSAIVKVLPTGTELSVLTRKGELAQIKDPEGVTGWVDAAYLMKEPPAASQLAQLKQEKISLTERLRKLETTTKSGKAGAADLAKVDALTNENTDLKSQLSAQKLKNGELEEELKALRKTVGGAAGGSVAGELQSANLELRKNLDAAQAKLAELEAELASSSAAGRLAAGARTTPWWAWLALVLLLAAAFAGGAWLTDWLARRRHGGFRI